MAPKRCGHLAGKELVPIDEMVLKLRAAQAARRDPDFTIIARTDARAVDGFEAAVERGRLKDKGADVIFPEALEARRSSRSMLDTSMHRSWPT